MCVCHLLTHQADMLEDTSEIKGTASNAYMELHWPLFMESPLGQTCSAGTYENLSRLCAPQLAAQPLGVSINEVFYSFMW